MNRRTPKKSPAANAAGLTARKACRAEAAALEKPLDLQHDDGEGEKGQCFDEHKSEDHRGANGGGSARVAGHAFAGSRSDPALAESSAERRDGHADCGGDREG